MAKLEVFSYLFVLISVCLSYILPLLYISWYWLILAGRNEKAIYNFSQESGAQIIPDLNVINKWRELRASKCTTWMNLSFESRFWRFKIKDLKVCATEAGWGDCVLIHSWYSLGKHQMLVWSDDNTTSADAPDWNHFKGIFLITKTLIRIFTIIQYNG